MDAPTPTSESPIPPPRLGWGGVLRAAGAAMVTDQAGLVAAGCAFYATLALFPAITMLVFIYGLMFDPVTVEPQLRVLEKLLPPEAYALIAERVHLLVVQPRGTLSIGLAISIAIAFYSASAGMRALLSALNLAFNVHGQRGILGFYAVGLLLTFGAILGAVIGIALLVFLPVAINAVGLDAYASMLVRGISFALLLLYVLAALALLYRLGPVGRPRGPWLSLGALVATVLWLLACAGLSAYIDHVASYDATYGSLGAVAAVMMWFYVTAYAVMLGAELDAQIERRRAAPRLE
jgi:membrane protein